MHEFDKYLELNDDVLQIGTADLEGNMERLMQLLIDIDAKNEALGLKSKSKSTHRNQERHRWTLKGG